MIVIREGKSVGILGTGDLILSRNPEPLKIDLDNASDIHVSIISFHFVGLMQKTRLGRFLFAMRRVWTYCE